MTFRPDSTQLRGTSYDKAHLYGMPNLGAHYYADNVNATEWDEDYIHRCAVCGTRSGFHSKHHEPTKGSTGSWNLQTHKGIFVLKPALIDLCGSGTEGCHGKRHNGLIRFRWEWYSDEYAEKWWDGTFLSQGLEPSGMWLFDYGYYVVDFWKENEWHKSHEIRGWNVEE